MTFTFNSAVPLAAMHVDVAVRYLGKNLTGFAIRITQMSKLSLNINENTQDILCFLHINYDMKNP